MALFKAFVSSVEVNGETVLSVVDGVGVMKAKAITLLAKHNIPDPKPGQWYKQQDWLDSFKEIAETIGTATLFSIGQKIPEKAKFPPAINTIDKALGAIDIAYHMNHRGGEIGNYTFQMVGEKAGKMVCKNPYPCAFDKGIIESMAKRFKPKDTLCLTVKHDDSQPCRTKGGESCTYLIHW